MQQTQQQQQTAALVRQLQQQLSSKSETSSVASSHISNACSLFHICKPFPLFSRYTTITGHQLLLLIMFVHSGEQSGGPALWIGGIHVSSPMKVVRRDDLKAQRTTKQMNESNVDH